MLMYIARTQLPLQLMSLLSRGKLAKLLLRDALDEALQASHDLFGVLRLQDGALGRLEQALDAYHAVPAEVVAHGVVDLLEDAGVEALPVGLVKDGVDEAAALERVGGDAAAGDERLGGARGAQAEGERARGAALGDEAERGKRRQEERLGRAVDKVGVADERGRQPDGRSVEAKDEHLGVLGERERRVEVEGGEVLQPVRVRLLGVRRRGPADAHIGAGGEEAALGQDDGHKDFVMLLNVTQRLRNLKVLLLREGIELALVVNCDDGDAATVF